MKKISIEQLLEYQVPKGSKIKNMLWVAWAILTMLFYDCITSIPSFSQTSSLWSIYTTLFFVVIFLLSDKWFLNEYVHKRFRVAAGVYAANIIAIFFVVIEPLVNNNYNFVDTGFGFLIRESAIIFYWILSIPLTLVYSYKYWLVGAMCVYLNSFLYFKFLVKMSELVEYPSNVYYFSTLGVVALTLILSFTVFMYQLKNRFETL